MPRIGTTTERHHQGNLHQLEHCVFQARRQTSMRMTGISILIDPFMWQLVPEDTDKLSCCVTFHLLDDIHRSTELIFSLDPIRITWKLNFCHILQFRGDYHQKSYYVKVNFHVTGSNP